MTDAITRLRAQFAAWDRYHAEIVPMTRPALAALLDVAEAARELPINGGCHDHAHRIEWCSNCDTVAKAVDAMCDALARLEAL